MPYDGDPRHIRGSRTYAAPGLNKVYRNER